MYKTLLLSGLFAMTLASSTAQDCKNYYYLQSGKTIEMSIYNKKGSVTGRQVYTVSNVSGGSSSTTGTVDSEMFDKKNKSIAKGHLNIECKNGVMMLDMTMLLPVPQQQQYAKADVKADKIYIEYPSSMKPGDMLKDATLNMSIDNAGMSSTVNMVISNRKVEGKESVTTTAGTWDCYKISFKNKTHIKTMGIGIPVNIDGTEWFAPGFGIVKTESKHGTTAITAIK
jgi:hypothetical protein